tara:strand:- start:2345 stop:3184 length:840 start_codon:yes stop_codon:yes gene_type:complete
MDNRFIVMTEYYKSNRNDRHKEIVKSIEVNCRIEQTKQVILFMDPTIPFPQELRSVLSEENFKKIKIHYTRPNDRARYADFFSYANEHLAGERCILCNNDISFDESLQLLDGFDLNGYFICLTRWDLMKDNSLRFKQPERIRKNSQDAWVFTPELPIKMIQKGQFYMGRPGCDGMVSYLATISGLKIMNPSEVIKAKHLHLCRYRTYGTQHRMGHDLIYMCIYPNDKIEYDVSKSMYRLFSSDTGEGEIFGEDAIKLAREGELKNEKHWNTAIKKCLGL